MESVQGGHHSSDHEARKIPSTENTTLQMRDRGVWTKGPMRSLFRSLRQYSDGDIRLCRTSTLEYIGRRGLSLSGSYQQGYSTAYNTRSHITVVCNGYILTHISN